jgi:hypothetical protein
MITALRNGAPRINGDGGTTVEGAQTRPDPRDWRIIARAVSRLSAVIKPLFDSEPKVQKRALPR